jgi:integrase
VREHSWAILGDVFIRDATMILMAYRHGLRAAELRDLRWEQVDFTKATARPVG